MPQLPNVEWGFLPGNSVLHRLDPRTKLLGLAGFGFCALGSWKWLPGLFLLTLGLIWLSRLPWRMFKRVIYRLKWLLGFSLLFHLLLTPGRVMFYRPPIVATWEGLAQGGILSIRLILFALWSRMLGMTTTPMQLVQGMEKLARPLAWLGLPVSEAVMMIGLSLRFVPILLAEGKQLMLAQAARGLDFSRRNLFHKAQNMLALLVPLLISVQRRAEHLASAMYTRGYSPGDQRTCMYALTFTNLDYAACGGVLGLVLLKCLLL